MLLEGIQLTKYPTTAWLLYPQVSLYSSEAMLAQGKTRGTETLPCGKNWDFTILVLLRFYHIKITANQPIGLHWLFGHPTAK